MKRKFLTILILFTAICLYSSKQVQASSLFEDNFNNGSANNWQETLGSQGSWFIQNQEYVGRVVKDRQQDLPTYSLAGNENWDDYKFDVRVQGDAGVDKLILFRYHSLNRMYAIKLVSTWPDWYGDKIALLKNNLINWTTSSPYVNKQGVWYKISVEARGPNIRVYINDSNDPIINFTDTIDPILSGKIGLLVWPGFYNGHGSVTANRFDDVAVSSLNAPSLDTLVLLPGLGASWNYEAMILDTPKEPEDWTMTPGVKVYDGLIQTLQNAGYTLNENLLVFNYDWRKPVADIANGLKNYLDRHPPSNGAKFNLVGHSLGGLVARTYVQENPNNQVNKLITIGSPHKGAVKAYYVWEGAELASALSGWQRIGAGILLQLKKENFETNVATVQHIIPGLKDLLPTFNYLKKNGNEKSLSSMQERNTWLENLNSTFNSNDFVSNSSSIIGIKGNTARWLKTQDRNPFDRILEKWVDGKPVGEEFDMGDITVLKDSARLQGVNAVELADLEHKELVETTQGQQAIVNALGITPSSIVPAPSTSYIPLLVLAVASPATLTVFDPSGQKIAENEKLVVINSISTGNYQVSVLPENTGGDYRLLVGKITSNGDVWREIDGTISSGQIQNYNINFSPNVKTNRTELFGLSKAKLDEAKQKALLLDSPVNTVLPRLIQFRILEVEKIMNHARKNLTAISLNETKTTISGITTLKNNISQQSAFNNITVNKKSEILKLIQEARDYLIQAYELK